MEAVSTSKELQQYLLEVSSRSELPDFSELKVKAQQLDIQLERLSENRNLLINSIEKSKQKARSYAISSIAGLIVSVISAFMSMYLFQGESSKDITEQVTNLSNIQKSLSELQSYVTDQKNLLQNLNKDISSRVRGPPWWLR